MIIVFLKVLAIFLMMAAGFLIKKLHWVEENASDYLVPVLMFLLNPCLLLHALAANDLEGGQLTVIWQIFIGSLLFFLVTTALSYVFVKALHYEPADDRGILMVLFCSINTGFMGFPVTAALFGQYYLFLMVMQNVILNVYLFVISPLQMNSGTGEKVNLRQTLRHLLSISNLAVMVGLFLFFAGLKLPPLLDEFTKTVGDATIPLSMILVGMQLAKNRLMEMFKNRKMVLVCLASMFVVPLLTFLAVNWLPLTLDARFIIIFASCFPAAVIPASIAMQMGKNAHLMSEGIAITTLLSVVTVPAAAMFLMGYYGL